MIVCTHVECVTQSALMHDVCLLVYFYVCIYVYVYMYNRVHTCGVDDSIDIRMDPVCMRTCIFVRVHLCMRVCIYV